jgi:DNA-binding IscR family transcriptional regulator
MIPELLTILRERKKISLKELSVLAKQKEEVTEQIMEQLVKRNIVKKSIIECHGCLKDCSACLSRSDLIFYELIL